MIIHSSENPILLNEYTSKKEYNKNKKKIDNIRRASREIDNEEKLSEFLKNHIKDINDILNKSKQKKKIDTSNKLLVTEFISGFGMLVGAELAVDDDSRKVGLITLLISGLTLIIQLIANLIKNAIQKNDIDDMKNMYNFCNKIKDNLSKHIEDPYDIKDQKLRSKYLELMHELDDAENKLFKATHGYVVKDDRYDSKTKASEEEIKLRVNTVKKLIERIKPYISDDVNLSINGNEYIRNFVSGYINAAEIYIQYKESINTIRGILDTTDKIKQILNELENDKIGFEYEPEIDENDKILDDYYNEVNNGVLTIYKKKK